MFTSEQYERTDKRVAHIPHPKYIQFPISIDYKQLETPTRSDFKDKKPFGMADICKCRCQRNTKYFDHTEMIVI